MNKVILGEKRPVIYSVDMDERYIHDERIEVFTRALEILMYKYTNLRIVVSIQEKDNRRRWQFDLVEDTDES